MQCHSSTLCGYFYISFNDFISQVNVSQVLQLILTTRISKYVALLPFTYKVMQSAPIELYSSRCTTYDPSVVIFGKLFRE